MFKNIKYKLRKKLPGPIWKILQILKLQVKFFVFRITIGKVKKNHSIAIDVLRGKKKVKVALFFLNVDTWKLDSVYNSFVNSDVFSPIVIICPFLSRGAEYLNRELKKSEDYCRKMKYQYFLAYNSAENITIDIKKEIKPDIIFFTNPNNLTHKKLLISHFLDTLTCYIPYSFRIDQLYKYEFDNDLVNYTWLNFYESDIHKRLSYKYARNKGNNVIVSGFPFMDSYKNRTTEERIYTNSNDNRKIVIWAPHWTIQGYQNTGLDWSCFLMYCNTILDIADRYSSQLIFIMKPHPFLVGLLYQESLWGKHKTDNYFKLWQEKENCQIVDGNYTELFLESDALIHDSGSFMTEYLALNKPVAYTLSESKQQRFNEFGNLMFSGHYKITCETDLNAFVHELLNNEDSMQLKREEIIRSQNLDKEWIVADKIVESIKEKICRS